MEEKKKLLLKLYCLQRIVAGFMDYRYLLSIERPAIISNQEIVSTQISETEEMYGKQHHRLPKEIKGALLVEKWPQKERVLNTQIKALYETHVDSFKTSLLIANQQYNPEPLFPFL